MPFSDYGLDHLVSQDLSKLSECGAPEMTGDFPKSKHWVTDFVLNSGFRYPLTPKNKQFGFFFLRRAQAAFIEYDYAREALAEYVATLPQRNTLSYFRALHHFEITITMLWQAYEAVRKLTGEDPFKPGDNSRYERLQLVYNYSRYSSPELPPDHLQRVRISNTGIHTAKCSLTFEQLQESLEEIGRWADMISSGGESGEDKSAAVSEKT